MATNNNNQKRFIVETVASTSNDLFDTSVSAEEPIKSDNNRKCCSNHEPIKEERTPEVAEEQNIPEKKDEHFFDTAEAVKIFIQPISRATTVGVNVDEMITEQPISMEKNVFTRSQPIREQVSPVNKSDNEVAFIQPLSENTHVAEDSEDVVKLEKVVRFSQLLSDDTSPDADTDGNVTRDQPLSENTSAIDSCDDVFEINQPLSEDTTAVDNNGCDNMDTFIQLLSEDSSGVYY